MPNAFQLPDDLRNWLLMYITEADGPDTGGLNDLQLVATALTAMRHLGMSPRKVTALFRSFGVEGIEPVLEAQLQRDIEKAAGGPN